MSSDSSASSGRTCLVWGANGVSGIASITALLEQPTSKIARVIAVSRREPQIPNADSRLHFLSIDILKTSPEDMAKKLKEAGGERIDTAFHYSYIEKKDPKELLDINLQLLDRALDATYLAAGSNLKHFHLQTGYKWYGVHLMDAKKMTPQPFMEDAPRNPDDPDNFYYHQVDHTVAHAKKHGYAWSETRPNPILGAAKGNFMNLALSTCIFLCLEKAKGKKQVMFPGNKLIYDTVLQDQSTAINNARFQVWLTEPAQAEKCANQAFNIHDDDNRKIGQWWQEIGKELGLEITPPSAAPEINAKPPVMSFSMTKWAEENAKEWEKVCREKGGDPEALKSHATMEFVEFELGMTYEQHGSLEKARKAGWTGKVDTAKEGYLATYRQLEEWKTIPKL